MDTLARLMAALDRLPMDKLRLVLWFAEFLAKGRYKFIRG